MIKHAQLVRIKKLKGAAIIEVAAKHNLREIAAEVGGYGGIDAQRVHLNYILRGADTSAGVAGAARLLMEQAKVKKLRIDAVRGLEVIFSLRPNSPIDGKAFFSDSLTWAESYFQPAPIVSAVVHCDEQAQHCHVIILPIIGGCMNGSRLMGNKPKLHTMQENFNEQVGQRYGLTYQAAGRRLRAAILPTACQDILKAIKANPERLSEPELGNALMVAFSYNSDAILLALQKETADTKPIGIVASPSAQSKENPIGFENESEAENSQSLSCVGFQISRVSQRPSTTRKRGRAQAKAEQVLEQLAAGIAKQDVAHNLGIGIASVYRILTETSRITAQ